VLRDQNEGHRRAGDEDVGPPAFLSKAWHQSSQAENPIRDIPKFNSLPMKSLWRHPRFNPSAVLGARERKFPRISDFPGSQKQRLDRHFHQFVYAF